MRKSIESGSRQAFAAEHLGPVLEGQIGRHDETLSLVSGTNDIEQQFGTDLAGWHVPSGLPGAIVAGIQRWAIAGPATPSPYSPKRKRLSPLEGQALLRIHTQ